MKVIINEKQLKRIINLKESTGILDISKLNNLAKKIVPKARQATEDYESEEILEPMDDYVTSHLGVNRYINDGSSRTVYQIDDDYVIKIAKNIKGLEQNSDEFSITQSTNSPLLPKILYVGYDSSFLISEYVMPLYEKDFVTILGITKKDWKNLCHYIAKYEGTPRMFLIQPEISRLLKKSKNPKFLKEFICFSFDNNVITTDLSSHNLGLCIRDGETRICILDIGLGEKSIKYYPWIETQKNNDYIPVNNENIDSFITQLKAWNLNRDGFNKLNEILKKFDRSKIEDYTFNGKTTYCITYKPTYNKITSIDEYGNFLNLDGEWYQIMEDTLFQDRGFAIVGNSSWDVINMDGDVIIEDVIKINKVQDNVFIVEGDRCELLDKNGNFIVDMNFNKCIKYGSDEILCFVTNDFKKEKPYIFNCRTFELTKLDTPIAP